jgi:hypothetical protein
MLRSTRRVVGIVFVRFHCALQLLRHFTLFSDLAKQNKLGTSYFHLFFAIKNSFVRKVPSTGALE